MSTCNLQKSVTVISTSPNRPNIKLSIIKTDKTIFQLKWIVYLLSDKKKHSPKILIYCRSITLVGWLYEQLMLALMQEAYVGRIRKKCNSLVGIYHSATPEKSKEQVLKSLTDETNMRLVIATSALGCGVNAFNVKYVVHFGPSIGLADYCQQIGRAGRNSDNQCHAILYLYPVPYKILLDDMKAYLTGSKCLRSSLYTPFNEDGNLVEPLSPAHLCCSFCEINCLCQNCEEFPYKPRELLTPLIMASACTEEANKVRELLLEYQKSFSNPNYHYFLPVKYVSGMSEEVIESIVCKVEYIKSSEDVIEKTKVVNKYVADHVVMLISKVFPDVTIRVNSLCDSVPNLQLDIDSEHDFEDDFLEEFWL